MYPSLLCMVVGLGNYYASVTKINTYVPSHTQVHMLKLIGYFVTLNFKTNRVPGM